MICPSLPGPYPSLTWWRGPRACLAACAHLGFDQKKRAGGRSALAAALDVVVGEEELPERELTPEEQERLHIRKRIQKLAQEKPEEVAMIMRSWLVED